MQTLSCFEKETKMTKPIDFKARWEKALNELDEVRKLSEKRRADRDTAIHERNEAIIRADMPKPPKIEIKYIEREVLPFSVAVFIITLAAVCGAYMLSMYMSVRQMQLPVYSPYEIKVVKYVDRDNLWKARCQAAWKVLEHHHSGVNNGRAFAILDGKDIQ
jgi:hypothetical protein